MIDCPHGGPWIAPPNGRPYKMRTCAKNPPGIYMTDATCAHCTGDPDYIPRVVSTGGCGTCGKKGT